MLYLEERLSKYLIAKVLRVLNIKRARAFVKFTLFFLLTVLIPVVTWAESEFIIPYIHKYEASFIYEGEDEDGLKTDLVAVLDDGSQWKIHSKYYEQFSKWNVSELVHVELKIQYEWYFFEKYHLALYNHERNECVEVSLLQSPLTIASSSSPQPASYIIQGFSKIYTDYRKNITTSDGERWEIANPPLQPSFSEDTPVYIGYNLYDSSQFGIVSYKLDEGKYIAFFVINGVEEKLDSQHCRFVRKGNYWYMLD